MMDGNNPSGGASDEGDRAGPPEAGLRRGWRGAGGGALLVAATFAAYVPALRSGYVWDDDEYLTENHLVQTPRGLVAVWAVRYDREAGRLRVNTPQYYPLVHTSYWVEHLIWGLHAAGYHTVNVLLHGACALLVWRITRVLGIGAGWFIAAVFALHPVHVESVAWITERKNVLSGLFYLLALLAFLRFFERNRAKWYLIGLLLLLAALLSKAVTCTLPVVILLIRWYQRRRISRRDVLMMMPLLILGTATGLFIAYLERTHVGAAGAGRSQTFLESALIIAPRALSFYAGKLAWPHPLIFIYPRWAIDTTAWTSYLALAGVLLVIVAALVAVRRCGSGPFVLLAYSGVTLFPALGFFEVYFHRFSWVADHFQYLGSLGFIILYTTIALWLGRRLTSSSKVVVTVGRAVAICVLLVLAALTYRQSRSYQNEQRLWADTLAANPEAWIASLNLGVLASKNGRYDKAAEYFEYTARYPVARSDAYLSWGNALVRVKRPDSAIAMFERSLAVNPHNAKSYAGLATALAAAGRIDEAAEALETSLRLNPEGLTAWTNLGLLRAGRGRWGNAESCFRRAVALAPHSAEPRVLYAKLLSKTQRWREAVEQYRAAQRTTPGTFVALPQLINALCKSADYVEALRVCKQGLRDTPNDVRLLRCLAWLRATCPVAAIRDGTQAVRIATKLARSSQKDPLVLDTLACAYAETGDFSAAVATAERALKAARRKKASHVVESIESRLELFRAGKPYRQTGP